MTSPGPTVRLGPLVRPAEPRDVPAIAATLTVAVADSRWARWALPEDGRMQRLTRYHELLAGHLGVATGGAWVNDDVTAVAAWEPPPGAGTEPPADVLAAVEREIPYLHADRAGPVAATVSVIAAARPAGPHWWLAHLGVRPSARRRGLAAAVLDPVLRRCDAEGTPAALAAFTWANVRFFRRHGFEVTTTTHTADDELPLWVLVRPAR